MSLKEHAMKKLTVILAGALGDRIVLYAGGIAG